MTKTGPLNSGALAGKLPKVRNSPMVAGILCASEYSSAARSLPAGAKKIYRDFMSAFSYVKDNKPNTHVFICFDIGPGNVSIWQIFHIWLGCPTRAGIAESSRLIQTS